MVFRITPSLGPDIEQVGPGYYDLDEPRATYQPGSVVFGNDGGEYHWMRASAAIAATATTGTQVVITPATQTIATGTGGFYTRPGVAVALGEYVHVRRGAWDAVPA